MNCGSKRGRTVLPTRLNAGSKSSRTADASKRSSAAFSSRRRKSPVRFRPKRSKEARKLSPGSILPTFSQLVEGLDSIFQLPYGCFEQTSSTTYPNVLALEYLRTAKKNLPEVEVKARQYIHLGYQRLLSFEIPGGGFDWFGNPPANRTLTAYGLMEFEDMARVHDVDPNLIERTRQWLLSERRADGSWEPESHAMHEDPTSGRSSHFARLAATAYIGAAVFNGRKADSQAEATQNYLLSFEPTAINDSYLLALVANALTTIDPTGKHAEPYLERLESMKKVSQDGKQTWWEQNDANQTLFYGRGCGGSVETTATAVLAMLNAHRHPATVRTSLSWLIQQQDARGTWYSTQATVLALKALLAGTGKPLDDGKPRQINIAVDGKTIRELTIPANQSDVMQQIDLTEYAGQGQHRITLTDRNDREPSYQVLMRYHLPEAEKSAEKEPLSIQLAYDKTKMTVNDSVEVTATVVNRMPSAAPMVMLDLPLPAGFAIAAEDMNKLVADGTIAKYQLTPRTAIVYLRELPPGKTLVLHYRLQATMPVKITAPPARVYEYYNPEKEFFSPAVALTVAEK